MAAQTLEDTVCRVASQKWIDKLEKLFPDGKAGMVLKPAPSQEAISSVDLTALKKKGILEKKGTFGPKSSLKLLVDIDAIKVERKQRDSVPVPIVTSPPARKRIPLTLENLVIFTEDLKKLVKSKEAEVIKSVSLALDDAVAAFNNNVKMGAGDQSLEASMKAVVKARKDLQDASITIVETAVKEMSKEGKYPVELINVML